MSTHYCMSQEDGDVQQTAEQTSENQQRHVKVGVPANIWDAAQGHKQNLLLLLTRDSFLDLTA